MAHYYDRYAGFCITDPLFSLMFLRMFEMNNVYISYGVAHGLNCCSVQRSTR